MIIVADKNRENVVYFEKNCYKYIDGQFIIRDVDTSRWVIRLTDRATNKSYEFNKDDSFFASYGFYSFLLDFTDLPQGEYEYKVITDNDEKNIVAKGLIRLNELEPDFIANEINREYVIYDKF